MSDTISSSAVACCYACGAGLQPECRGHSEQDALRYEHWDNALVVSLQGGYGMFIDNLDADISRPDIGRLGEYKVVICHDCAHRLCEQVPWMNQLIEPLRSHSHKVGRDWSGHAGWDLPHICPSCGQRTVFCDAEQRKVCPGSCRP